MANTNPDLFETLKAQFMAPILVPASETLRLIAEHDPALSRELGPMTPSAGALAIAARFGVALSTDTDAEHGWGALLDAARRFYAAPAAH